MNACLTSLPDLLGSEFAQEEEGILVSNDWERAQALQKVLRYDEQCLQVIVSRIPDIVMYIRITYVPNENDKYRVLEVLAPSSGLLTSSDLQNPIIFRKLRCRHFETLMSYKDSAAKILSFRFKPKWYDGSILAQSSRTDPSDMP